MREIAKDEFWGKLPKRINEKSINNVSMTFYKNINNEYFMIYRTYNMRHNYMISLEYFEISYYEYLEENDGYDYSSNKYDSSNSDYKKRFNYGYDD
ncbi:hypothetical protein D7X98_12220 [bacterium 1XD8-76]|nr:hypothetical protein D7X98_12220 [bacterium 1XD8-76]